MYLIVCVLVYVLCLDSTCHKPSKTGMQSDLRENAPVSSLAAVPWVVVNVPFFYRNWTDKANAFQSVSFIRNADRNAIKVHVCNYRPPFRAVTGHPVTAEPDVALDDLPAQRTHDDVAPLPSVIGCRHRPNVTSRWLIR